MVNQADTDWQAVLQDIPKWALDHPDESVMVEWATRKGYDDHGLWHVAIYMTGVMSAQRVDRYRNIYKAFQT